MLRRLLGLSFAFLLLVSGVSLAQQEEPKDITEEVIVGPGTVSIATKKDIMMSFGALIRFIPTAESNWDFGMSDNVPGYLINPVTMQPTLDAKFFEAHFNESGTVRDGYIRNEDKLYFNAMPKDRKWSFYAALEYDRPIDTDTVDNRGGRGDNSNFGLERLNVSVALPFNTRLHAGWDVWGFDHGEAASMVYGDDNPGFWLEGTVGRLSYNIGYFKLEENDFQTSLSTAVATREYFDSDADRDLFAGWAEYKLNDSHKIRAFYGYDRIRSVQIGDMLGLLSGGQAGIVGNYDAEIDSHHLGAYYVGNFGGLKLMLEGVYQFGSADNTGLSRYGKPDDYDISAYALAADISYDLKDLVGFSLKPHVGVMYTSGDDDPNDDELNGYEGIENAQRFSEIWGGENTIIGDTNFVLGTILYGYIPELYGNGTPVFTGGLQNAAGSMGGGRGDNPGLTMLSVGLTAAPRIFLIYRTNFNFFWWNEDFVVTNWVNPTISTPVESGYAGFEWDNELTLALNKNTFIKGQMAFFFPGDVIKDVTRAISGTESDDVASRIAAELIWKF
ncbi:hypothetical protein [Thermodesulforhabdus norvegica]|uniref:Alginate export n=1 Tax=Thermodesulforhabdus norvegica TaxID=39841 RepID=A0A1I4SF02_9BACT|nr:hypothetical protein [Thermodesulforhabdus norvegica]SFM63056.1 hypothetical protein SAMN05660836_00929 [Thermodesulforhabdus norvegica]